MKNSVRRRIAAILATAAIAAGSITAGASVARADTPASPAPLTNLAHLDFLLGDVAPAATDEHTSYRLTEEPSLRLPWTYADARDGGTFERVGGGPLDPATGHYAQGAYNSDDVARAAVVYLRHWQQTGDDSSRQKAYEVLRALAYFQTVSGPDAGNVVLWMQPDGQLNPSAIPVELPDPSDSAESYWLARSLWAFGEGYAAFKDADPAFAAFLQQRLQLGVGAVDREVLDSYGQHVVADGVTLPAWLIVNGADATAEAVLGLSAYTTAAPEDAAVRDSLTKLAGGIAEMAATTTADPSRWPYGAILPWAESRSMWHAWSSQMSGALARASVALGDAALLRPAVTESARFAPTLLSAGGPDNGWYPSPTERVQIAYGADSRLQDLLATADASGSAGFAQLAGLQGAWFFGLNPAAAPMYDPATGVTFDGIQPDGSINRNSGAESTIHGLLSMLALDAHPDVAAVATAVTHAVARNGLQVVEAESAAGSGTVVTPDSTWTGESSWSGSFLSLERGQTATFDLGASAVARIVEPVSWQVQAGAASGSPRSLWSSGWLPLGVLKHEVGAQGITAVPGALLPQKLPVPLPAERSTVTVRAIAGTVQLDALLVRPVIGSLVAESPGGGGGGSGDVATSRVELVHNSLGVPWPASVGADGVHSILRSYDASGALVEQRALTGRTTVLLRAGGFAVLAP